ncbi:MAG: hypothetical protein VYB98_05535, partial [Actinomycetota bacterium]|nr:hypothetical protein [Actinomycetota bacterium]
SAMRGGLLFSRGLMAYANKTGRLQLRADDSLVDEFVGYFIVALGFYVQWNLGFDLPFMLAVAVACLPIFVNGYVIKRWEGVLFTGYYVGYLVWLGLDAASASIHDEFSFAMLVFVVPLTAITLIVIGLRAARPAQTAAQ